MNGERGAVAVIAALLMVPMIGFVAISVDVASMWSSRQQLQTGADAGVLAIAQDCARKDCKDPVVTAQDLATVNINDGDAIATVTDPTLTPATATVTVRNEKVEKHLFAPVLGFDSSIVGAKATATWGVPGGGTAMLPLLFSYCEFRAQTGGGLPSGTAERTIFFTKDSATTCTGPSNNAVPGGFAWIDTDAGTCRVTSKINNVLYSSTGASVPTGCAPADMSGLQNKVVLLPLFEAVGDTGTSAWYRVYGYAAFRLTGYNFPSKSYTFNASGCLSPSRNCIKGYFTEFVDLSSAFQIGDGAPDLGAAVVKLTP